MAQHTIEKLSPRTEIYSANQSGRHLPVISKHILTTDWCIYYEAECNITRMTVVEFAPVNLCQRECHSSTLRPTNHDEFEKALQQYEAYYQRLNSSIGGIEYTKCHGTGYMVAKAASFCTDRLNTMVLFERFLVLAKYIAKLHLDELAGFNISDESLLFTANTVTFTLIAIRYDPNSISMASFKKRKCSDMKAIVDFVEKSLASSVDTAKQVEKAQIIRNAVKMQRRYSLTADQLVLELVTPGTAKGIARKHNKSVLQKVLLVVVTAALSVGIYYAHAYDPISVASPRVMLEILLYAVSPPKQTSEAAEALFKQSMNVLNIRPAEAESLLQQSASANHPEACFTLAARLSTSTSASDTEKARSFDLYTKAARLGHEKAQRTLAFRLSRGGNTALAAYWYCVLLEQMEEQASGQKKTPETQEARARIENELRRLHIPQPWRMPLKKFIKEHIQSVMR